MQREERLWAEVQLRAERRKNMRLGIAEPLDTTMARVQVGGAGIQWVGGWGLLHQVGSRAGASIRWAWILVVRLTRLQHW
jgi:hypothetical protein